MATRFTLTPLARQQLDELRGRRKLAVADFLIQIESRGCAALDYRLTGDGPLEYQWEKDGRPIAGATSAAFTTAAARPEDSGASYRCVVQNRYGGVRTRPAAVWVVGLRQPPPAGPMVAGLEYQYYEGQWTSLPDLDSLRPARAGSAAARRREAAGSLTTIPGC